MRKIKRRPYGADIPKIAVMPKEQGDVETFERNIMQENIKPVDNCIHGFFGFHFPICRMYIRF